MNLKSNKIDHFITQQKFMISALCGGTVTSTSGVISPPMTSNFTYPNQLLCHWKLAQRYSNFGCGYFKWGLTCKISNFV